MNTKKLTLEDLSSRATCTVEQAAKLLEVGRSTAYAAARDGSLPTIRVSRRLLVPAAALRRLLALDDDDAARRQQP